jgi:hypothetical protein
MKLLLLPARAALCCLFGIAHAVCDRRFSLRWWLGLQLARLCLNPYERGELPPKGKK